MAGETEQKIEEVGVVVRLVDEDREIATVEKFFGFVQDDAGDIEGKSIDDLIQVVIQEVVHEANERGYVVPEKEVSALAVATAIFLVKCPVSVLDITVNLEREAEEGDGGANTDTELSDSDNSAQ